MIAREFLVLLEVEHSLRCGHGKPCPYNSQLSEVLNDSRCFRFNSFPFKPQPFLFHVKQLFYEVSDVQFRRYARGGFAAR